jgi:hypothetical protein
MLRVFLFGREKNKVANQCWLREGRKTVRRKGAHGQREKANEILLRGS